MDISALTFERDDLKNQVDALTEKLSLAESGGLALAIDLEGKLAEQADVVKKLAEHRTEAAILLEAADTKISDLTAKLAETEAKVQTAEARAAELVAQVGHPSPIAPASASASGVADDATSNLTGLAKAIAAHKAKQNL